MTPGKRGGAEGMRFGGGKITPNPPQTGGTYRTKTDCLPICVGGRIAEQFLILNRPLIEPDERPLRIADSSPGPRAGGIVLIVVTTRGRSPGRISS